MFAFETQIRVRYAETDQMGYTYYGNYAMYYEVARVEALRSLSMSYKELEQTGIMMPVLENFSKYIRPARYDDLLTISVKILQPPATRMKFDYEIFGPQGQLIHIGYTVLVFVDMKTGKPCAVPQQMEELFKPFFLGD